ncbi:MAG TPA: hypothetical protein VMF61_02125 [Candidatus Acidoferrales bacterium]|nr:hypothetical protein [Candidatus Acidoferrales bacterium]
MTKRLFSSVAVLVLAACSSPSSPSIPSGGPAPAIAHAPSYLGGLQEETSPNLAPHKTITIHSAKGVFYVNGKGYPSTLNGTCHLSAGAKGTAATGCLITAGITITIQKATIGLYTKPNGKGCLAAAGSIGKTNLKKGKVIPIKFLSTGKC